MQQQWDSLGDSLQMNNLGQCKFARLIKAAKDAEDQVSWPCVIRVLRCYYSLACLRKSCRNVFGHRRIEIEHLFARAAVDAQDAAAKLASILMGEAGEKVKQC